MELNRRGVFRSTGVLAGATVPSGTAAAPEALADTENTVTIDEGTNISAVAADQLWAPRRA